MDKVMHEQLKILILLMYFNRPNMVRNALYSIKLANTYYKNWILAFNDDASPIPGKPTVEEILGDCLDRVRFYRLDMTPEEKIMSGGIMGKCLNEIIEEIDADIGIMLCDDDALFPSYLYELNEFFNAYPHVNSTWNNVEAFYPCEETLAKALERSGFGFQGYCEPDKPMCCASRADASQVAWRIKCNKELGAWFKWPLEHCHDHFFYSALYETSGPSWYGGMAAQFKGVQPKQLTQTRGFWPKVVLGDYDIDTTFVLKASDLPSLPPLSARVNKRPNQITMC
jgi:hypothetical protein